MKKILFSILCAGIMLTACGQQNKNETTMDFTDDVQVALADSGHIDLNSLQWTREPKDYEVKGDTILITTAPKTNLWQRTYYHFQNNNAPVLQMKSIEDYREFCLSLGEGIEEKLPFQKFKNGEGVLVFYVMGHMFSFFDCNDFSVISLKCQPERIEDLKAQYECIGNPYNESPKHWIGIDPNSAPDDLLQELTRNSYEIVKEKYTKK